MQPLLAVLLLLAASTSSTAGTTTGATAGGAATGAATGTARAHERRLRRGLQAGAELERRQELRQASAHYAALLSASGGAAPSEALLGAHTAAGRVSRQLKRHDGAYGHHEAALRLRGSLGAIAESYLLAFTQMATDRFLAGRFVEARELLRTADTQFAAQLAPDGAALLQRMRAFVCECQGEYGEAAALLRRSRELLPAAGPRQRLDDLLLQRQCVRRQRLSLPLRSGGALRAEEAALDAQLLTAGPWSTVLQMPAEYDPGLAARAVPWPRIGDFPALQRLVDALESPALVSSLAAEYADLKAKGLLQRDQDCIQSKSGAAQWSRFELSGVWNLRGAERCSKETPVACELQARLRAMLVVPVLRVGYSAVQRGAWIRPHFGRTNRQLKLHLGVKVPSGDCAWMRVGEERRAWQTGRVSFLDDSWEHEVRNECRAERVVLQVVVEHPSLSLKPLEYAPLVEE